MTTALVVIGAGGFGREVVDVIDAINAACGSSDEGYEFVGFLDDGEPDASLLETYGVGLLGPVSALAGLDPDIGYVIGIGDPSVRRAIDERWRTERQSPTLVHPSATLGRAVDLGPGTVVCSHVSMTNHVRLGRHVHVNLNCTVGHDSRLDDYVTMSPLVAISGNVIAESGAFFGTGSKVNPGLSVGVNSVVGTGAAVVRPVLPGTTVVGVPAKPRS